jgi:putative oxidoreductase
MRLPFAGSDLGLLILRLWFGLVLAIGHGWPKVNKIEAFIATVARHDFPMPRVSALLAIFGELCGGVLLALGLAARPAAVFVTATMLLAAFKVHATDPFLQKKELALAYAVAALVVLVCGPGRYSIDAMIRDRLRRGGAR